MSWSFGEEGHLENVAELWRGGATSTMGQNLRFSLAEFASLGICSERA
jgi:hypothetical protein